MKVGASGQERHWLLAGIDEVRILAAGCWRRTHAEEPILAVQEDFALRRQEIGDDRWEADAQIDISALGNVARDPRGHLLPGEAVHRDPLMLPPAPAPALPHS